MGCYHLQKQLQAEEGLMLCQAGMGAGTGGTQARGQMAVCAQVSGGQMGPWLW